MNTVHIDSCPICDSTNFSYKYNCKDFYASGEHFEVHTCNGCGFIFTQNFPSEEWIGKYYETKDYISHSNTKKGIVNKLYHVVRKFMLNKKAELIKSHTHTSAPWLLDIGCGTGFFLSQMARRGWSVKGIEKNKEAREFAHKEFSILVNAPEKMAEFEDHTFGVITLWHSLEHLENLNETLKQIGRLLVENGTVFIAVPNAASYDESVYKEYWAAYDVPRHLWHFTPDSMKNLAEKHGFSIETMKGMPFDAFYVSMLSEKYMGRSLSFLRGMITGKLAFFSSLGKPEKSSSIIYVLRKSENFNFHV